MQDILDITPPAGIPGALFNALADHLAKRYPPSKQKAKLVTLELLDILGQHYAELAAEEEKN